jgi:hypothetical protein
MSLEEHPLNRRNAAFSFATRQDFAGHPGRAAIDAYHHFTSWHERHTQILFYSRALNKIPIVVHNRSAATGIG